MVKFPYRPNTRLKCLEGTNAFHETITKEILQSKTLSSNLPNKKTQQIEKEKQSPPRTKRTKVLETKKYLNDDAKVHNVYHEHESLDIKQLLESKHKSSRKKPLLKDKIHDMIEAPLVSLGDIKKRLYEFPYYFLFDIFMKI